LSTFSYSKDRSKMGREPPNVLELEEQLPCLCQIKAKNESGRPAARRAYSQIGLSSPISKGSIRSPSFDIHEASAVIWPVRYSGWGQQCTFLFGEVHGV
jgi:hypothetical protein